MTGPGLVHALADAIDGTVRAGTLILILDGDRVNLVDCTSNGKVVLSTPNGGPYQLGSVRDDVEYLANKYRAATVEVTC